jgi:hypothetical protein
MHYPVKSMSFGALLCFLAVSPVITTGNRGETNEVTVAAGHIKGSKSHAGVVANTTNIAKSAAAAIAEEAMNLYGLMDLKRLGLSLQGFEYAWKGYKYLVENKKIDKNDVLSICDFSQSSRRKRFYVIDIAEKKVLINTWVAHGRNSGGEYARSFSNNPDSHKSSLGFYVTRSTYYGSHGLALKIALPADETPKVIETIKDGSCLFIYHPTKSYIQKSKVLNG